MQKDIINTEKNTSNSLFLQINSLAKAYSFQQISYNTCEICYKTLNLICCGICKNFYHAKCLNLPLTPSNFICPKCKDRIPNASKIFNENSKSSSDFLNEEISTNFQANNLKKKTESKRTKLVLDNTTFLPNNGTSETNGINNINNSDEKSEYSHELKSQTNQSNNIKTTNSRKGLLSNKRKRGGKPSRRIGDNNSEQKNAHDYNSSRYTATPSNHIQGKRKSITNKANSYSLNGVDIHTASQSARKELETKIMNEYDHSNPQYRRRKIKKGTNYNIDMYEFQDRYTNQINFEDEEYERKQLTQVYSSSQNPLSQEEIDSYLKTARLFWDYRNIYLEEELCSDFFEECDKLLAKQKQKLGEKLKTKIKRLMKELKNLVRRGVDLNCHYDEMALKMLHLCKYKKKVALLFLKKQLNPFIEEVEEGFKNDVTFFQSEIISLINDGDIEMDE